MTAQKPLPRYLIDFLEYCEVEKGLTPVTTRNYQRFLKKFFLWLAQNKLDDIIPADLTEDHIRSYRMWLSRQPNMVRKASLGLDTSTQTRYLIALRIFLSFFHERGLPCLPTEKIKLQKEKRERKVKFLDFRNIEKLLETPNTNIHAGLRDRALLETMFSTGMRVSELVALDKKQFSGLGRTQDAELSITGKGGYPRTVYVSTRALAWIQRYLEKRDDDEPALFVRLGGPTGNSQRLGIRGIELLVKKYAVLAGVPVLATPHTLRHSFATDLLSQGVDLRSVQEFLGHRNIATTQVYTHVTNKRLRDIHRQVHGKRK